MHLSGMWRVQPIIVEGLSKTMLMGAIWNVLALQAEYRLPLGNLKQATKMHMSSHDITLMPMEASGCLC